MNGLGDDPPACGNPFLEEQLALLEMQYAEMRAIVVAQADMIRKLRDRLKRDKIEAAA